MEDPARSARAWQAPGKLVLLGEYAVLDGAFALVLAVDRGVACRVSETVPGSAPPGFFLGRCQGRSVLTPVDDQRFVTAALDAVKAKEALYTFVDTGAPLDPRILGKPGFGGSAAATVAAVLAGGGTGPEAYTVHAAVQGGGSGLDVAACLSGGLVSYRFRDGARQIRPVALPPLQPVVVWSGNSAATAPRVRAWKAWTGNRNRVARAMDDLVSVFLSDPIRATREARTVLLESTSEAGILYETPALARIALEAMAQGGAARPSGAGGGDCAVAWLEDDAARRRFEDRVSRLGFPTIAVRPAPGAGLMPHPPDPFREDAFVV
jgi:phosphomevalonate kinase